MYAWAPRFMWIAERRWDMRTGRQGDRLSNPGTLVGMPTYAGPRYGNPFDDPRYGLYKTDKWGYWVPVRSPKEDVNKSFTNKRDTAMSAPPLPPQFPDDYYAYPAYYETRKSYQMPIPYDYEGRGVSVYDEHERPEKRSERLSRLSRPPTREMEERATARYSTRRTTQQKAFVEQQMGRTSQPYSRATRF